MSQIDEIKNRVDIVQLIGERVDLKKAGRNYKGLCPFHSEKTPSFMVSPERGSFKCFGCGEGGDVFSFLQKYDGMSFLEALEFLADRVGVKLERYKPTKQDVRRKRLLEVLDLASEFYAWVLLKHKLGIKAKDYLKSRSVFSEAIKNFKLGYAPDSWRSVSDFLIKKKGFGVDELDAVGLIVRRGGGGYYDRFRGRIMFPLRDHRGRVVGFSGRVLDSEVKEAKYINSPETVLYMKRKMLYGLFENRQFIKKADSIVLVEGEMDAIASWQAGVKNVVAIKGSAFTEDQAMLISRYTKNVVMALDADSAGEEAVKRAVKIADELDLNVRVVEISGGKDPCDVATTDPKMWREMVKSNRLYYDFLIDSSLKKFDVNTGDGVKGVTNEVLSVIGKISNLPMKAHYVKKLSKKLGMSEEVLYDEMERLDKKRSLRELKNKVVEIESGKSDSRRERVERYLASIIVQYCAVVSDKLQRVQSEWFSIGSLKRIVGLVLKWNGDWDVKKFGSSLAPELQDMMNDIYLRDLGDIEKVGVVKEFERVASELEGLYLRDEMKKISSMISDLERKGGSADELDSLRERFSSMARKLSVLG